MQQIKHSRLSSATERPLPLHTTGLWSSTARTITDLPDSPLGHGHAWDHDRRTPASRNVHRPRGQHLIHDHFRRKEVGLVFLLGSPAPVRRISMQCACGGGVHRAPWPMPPPCVTFRRVVVSLRGPGQSPVLPFACCVGSLRSVGRCGRCSCWCHFCVRGAQRLVCWGCAGCGGMCRLRVTGAQ